MCLCHIKLSYLYSPYVQQFKLFPAAGWWLTFFVMHWLSPFKEETVLAQRELWKIPSFFSFVYLVFYHYKPCTSIGSTGLIRTLDSITKGNGTFLLKGFILHPIIFWNSGHCFSYCKLSLSRAFREIITRRGCGVAQLIEPTHAQSPRVELQHWIKLGVVAYAYILVLRRWR